MFYLEEGEGLFGRRLKEWEDLLARVGLRPAQALEWIVCAYDEAGAMVATGGMHQGLIQCVAVDPAHQGAGLMARILTGLMNRAHAQGVRHLFVYTKPEWAAQFKALGFTALVSTRDVLLMESVPRGLASFLEGLRRPEARPPIGGIVAHCDPFTRGHRHLVETAAAQCGFVYVFVLSEDRGMFPAQARLDMVRAGTGDLPNVAVCETGPYMVSAALFPTYFLPDGRQGEAVHGALDLELFGARIAPYLGITRRYVGTEPFSQTTRAYNQRMHEVLGRYGMETVEIPRAEIQGQAVSASRVRALLRAGDLDGAKALVPDTTAECLDDFTMR